MPGEIVLFDADCPLCRSLAELASRRSRGKLAFQSWQEFRSTRQASEIGQDIASFPADVLRVWDGVRLIEGEAAWHFLIERYQDLKPLGWLAAKLGLERRAAQLMESGGRVLRRLCWRCPRQDGLR
jgi:predicted DCC family thiol-disulfide oxidoreductase YuxK